jgi:hypothetical protein
MKILRFPAIKLKSVVLPEPLGPIIPVILPFLIDIEQSETAAKPPKFFDNPPNFQDVFWHFIYLIFYKYYQECLLLIYKHLF